MSTDRQETGNRRQTDRPGPRGDSTRGGSPKKGGITKEPKKPIVGVKYSVKSFPS